MRRITAIFISIYYLVLVTGLTVNIHSCLGEIENITLSQESNDCCCNGEEMTSSCCDDDLLILQFDSDEQLVKSVTTNFKFQVHEIVLENQNNILESDFISYKPIIINKTEIPLSVPIWLKNSNFTFYG